MALWTSERLLILLSQCSSFAVSFRCGNGLSTALRYPDLQGTRSAEISHPGNALNRPQANQLPLNHPIARLSSFSAAAGAYALVGLKLSPLYLITYLSGTHARRCQQWRARERMKSRCAGSTYQKVRSCATGPLLLSSQQQLWARDILLLHWNETNIDACG